MEGQEVFDAVVRVAEKHENQSDEEEKIVTLVSGVKMRMIGVSPFLLMNLESQPEFKHKPVPTVYDEDRGREIPNPNDPIWIDDCEDRDRKKGEAMLDVIIAVGAELLEIPDNLPAIESPDWSEALEIAGKIKVPDSGLGRKLAWVKYIAIRASEDATNIVEASRKQLGITEEEVQEAIAGFPGDKERDTDN